VYTIKQAAQRAGVSVPLLRAWERRYHVVEPQRTASGYRLYDDGAIARLQAMRALIDDGWSPSNAAARVLREDDASIAQLRSTSTSRRSPGTLQNAETDALAGTFVNAAAALDEAGYEAALDEMFARGSFEHVASAVLMPALEQLGDGWAAGRLDVAAEHAAAAAVQRRLGLAYMAAGSPREGGSPVLVGMPPGARHELGALAFATAARRAGMAVRYLGADLPVENWIDAVVRTDAIAAVIGIVIDEDIEPAFRVARAIHATRPNLVIAFGGPASPAAAARSEGEALVLPEPLTEAVDMLQQAVARAATPR
jgi:DNA-binding transcriptional MerR regulator/methylmalonyl-CoA mutase cobalamin-binding subunit